ncbi:MAG TPA: hypothetical protein VEZ11_07620 [Thermoanaerobaculia bacterium]|nr:hypothetical protein [Thermoanaerobaculia bacterium]
MKIRYVAIAVLTALLSSAHAGAQIAADLVAASQIPAGSLFAPHTPSGVMIIGPNLWVGDEVQGLRHYVPVDPSNADPINTGNLMFDSATEWSMGGGSACVPWCSVGQVAQDGTTRAYVAAWDHPKGQPGQFGGPGIWMVQFQSEFGNFSPFAGASPLAPTFGLGGDLPTAVALGPEGKLYVGFLKNGNIKRITNPSVLNPTSQNQTVESVGGTPNGRSMRAMAFLGADLYMATDQGMAVVHHAAACIGNQGGCGNAVLVQDGHVGADHVGIATDAASKVYFSVNGAGTVYRYTPLDGRVVPVSSGFTFVGGHTNTLTLDGFGNLWIGDDTTDGTFNFTGRLWRIPAAALASIP